MCAVPPCLAVSFGFADWLALFQDHESAVLELSNSSNANPGAPALTAKDSTASSRRIDTLRTDFAVAQTELDSASAAADKLKASLAAAEKLVEVQRKRVEKREKRLKRAVEKAERKKVCLSLSLVCSCCENASQADQA